MCKINLTQSSLKGATLMKLRKSLIKYSFIGLLCAIMLLVAFVAIPQMGRTTPGFASGDFSFPVQDEMGREAITLNMMLDLNGENQAFSADQNWTHFDRGEGAALATNPNNRFSSRGLGIHFALGSRIRLLRADIPADAIFELGDFGVGITTQTTGIYNPHHNTLVHTELDDPNHIAYIRLTALAVMESGAWIRIRVNEMRPDSNQDLVFYTSHDVFVHIAVRATFAHATAEFWGYAQHRNLFVQNATPITPAPGAQRITLTNNSFQPTFINFNTVLRNRLLEYNIPIPSSNVARYPVTAGGEPWVLNYVNDLSVANITVMRGIEGGMTNITGNLNNHFTFNRSADSPNFTAMAHVSQSATDAEMLLNSNTPLYLRVEFEGLPYSIFVHFELEITLSAGPVRHISQRIPTVLNRDTDRAVTTAGGVDDRFVFDSSDSDSLRNDPMIRNFRALDIHATDLVDMAAPYGYGIIGISAHLEGTATPSLSFVHMPGSQVEGFVDVHHTVRIFSIAHGRQDVTFTIHYVIPAGGGAVGGQRREMEIRVPFVVFGGHELIQISVNSRSRTTIDLLNQPNAELERLAAAGFTIERRYDTTSAYYAHIDFQQAQNQFTIRPQATGTERTVWEARNAGTVVFVTIDFVIDRNVGFFWGWVAWQRILFLVAMGLAAILLLILIILIIRAIVRGGQPSKEEAVPTSSYIVKLNSAIAAAQVQQRMSMGYGVTNGMAPLQLAAPASVVAPPMEFSQLAAPAPMPQQSQGVMPPSNAAILSSSDTVATQASHEHTTNVHMAPPMGGTHTHVSTMEIIIPLTDEQLIERIFLEKYEPRGMTRRSFYKSKELQARELEKEKQRIRDAVAQGSTMEEACGIVTESQTQASYGNTTPDPLITKTGDHPAQDGTPVNPLIAILGFDPNEKVVVEIPQEEKQREIIIDENGEEKFVFEETTDEEAALAEANKNFSIADQERVIYMNNIETVQASIERTEGEVQAFDIAIMQTQEEIEWKKNEITDLEVKMASSRGKEKDRITKEIAASEERLRLAQERLTVEQNNKQTKEELMQELHEVSAKLKNNLAEKEQEAEQLKTRISECEKAAAAAAVCLERARQQQLYDNRAAYLSPIMNNIYFADRDVKRAQEEIETLNAEKALLKSDVSALKMQLLNTTDPQAAERMSDSMAEKNDLIHALDGLITDNTKFKSAKSIELAALKKKSIDYIEKEEMSLEDVSKCEDEVIRQTVFNEYQATLEAELTASNDAIESALAHREKLESELDVKLNAAVMGLANEIKTIEEQLALNKELLESIESREEEIAANEEKLADLDTRMSNASDEEMLDIMQEQADVMAGLEELRAQQAERDAIASTVAELTEQEAKLKLEGKKANILLQEELEAELETARQAIEIAKERLEKATAETATLQAIDDKSEITDIRFVPGSGVVSQERKAFEDANLAKRLERERAEIEKAKLAANLAREEAEKAKEAAESEALEMLKAADEARQEADKIKEEAEEKAKEEAELARMVAMGEVEKAKQEAKEEADLALMVAMGEVEKAKQEAQEETEKARQEAEIAMARAQAEADETRAKVQEEAQIAQAQAEAARISAEAEADKIKAEAEEARTKAATDADEARKKAEEELEALKRDNASELERMRTAMEEDAKRLSEMSQEEKDRLAQKVQKRKEEIAQLRAGLEEVTNAKEGEALAEKFTQLKLTFDQEEQSSAELRELIERSKNDAINKGKLADAEARANKAPKVIVKKKTERVNVHQNPGTKRPPPAGKKVTNVKHTTSYVNKYGAPPSRPGAAPRPAGAAPTRPGVARPGAARPGAPTARPGAPRPTGAAPRPGAARPGVAPPARPGTARPGAAPRPGAPRPRPGGTPPPRPR